ncbi:MAG: hypothetical protein WC292_07310 [Clostridia bacterium]
MNKTAKTIGVLHGTAFTLFFIINKLLDYVLYPLITKAVSSEIIVIAISVVLSAFLYGIIYTAASTTYKLYYFRFKDKSLFLKGTWYHIHIPYDINKRLSVQSIRGGKTVIDQTFFDYRFRGENVSYRYNNNILAEDTSRSTSWSYKFVHLEEADKTVYGCYGATSANDSYKEYALCPKCERAFDTPKKLLESRNERLGIHKLKIIDEDGKLTLRGHYTDTWPSANNGMIYFFKTREERDAFIIKYFQECRNEVE